MLVLEARNRIGGRILTVEDPRVPLPIELGAEFIHGGAPVTGELLARAGLSAFDVRGEFGTWLQGKPRQTDYFFAIDHVLRHVDHKGPDQSVADFLAERPGGRALERERALTRHFVEGFHAADVHRISAQSISAGPDGPPSEEVRRAGRVTRGYGALVEWLARDLGTSIRLHHEVKSVEWREGHVAVEGQASGQSWRCTARAAIVTAPIGVLRARAGARGSIAIDPEPARLRRALDGFEMGTVVRLVVWFREFPWSSATQRFDFVQLTDGPFAILWTASPVRWPLAVVWCGGLAAADLSLAPRAEVLRIMRKQLAHAIGISSRRLERSIRNVWWHDWDRDPYTRGAYTYVRVGEIAATRALPRPEEGTLFFAGEATEPESGTVEAALSSGRRAARQVHRALGRR